MLEVGVGIAIDIDSFVAASFLREKRGEPGPAAFFDFDSDSDPDAEERLRSQQ